MEYDITAGRILTKVVELAIFARRNFTHYPIGQAAGR